MSTTSERQPFVEVQFLEDLAKSSAEMDAPYSEDAVKEIVKAHGEWMHDAAIQLRGSNAPGNPILIRLMFAVSLDTIGMALTHGWLHPDNPMVELAKSVRDHCKGTFEQPEFSADKGCDGVFMYVGGVQSLDYVLEAPAMPDCIRANRQQFLDLRLDSLITLGLNYTQKLVSIYFLAEGPLSREDFNRTVAMAGADAPSDAIYQDIVGVLLDSPYYLTVVMEYETGKVVKVDFHLLFPVKLPPEMNIPDVGERLTNFWDLPSYEYEDMDILSFCFGDTSSGDILAWRGYCGGLRSLMRSWGIIGV